MTLKKIIFFHYSFAIPAMISWETEREPMELKLEQTVALDLPKEMRLVIDDRKLVGFPEIFHDHMDTLRSITEVLRDQGVSVYLMQRKILNILVFSSDGTLPFGGAF